MLETLKLILWGSIQGLCIGITGIKISNYLGQIIGADQFYKFIIQVLVLIILFFTIQYFKQ